MFENSTKDILDAQNGNNEVMTRLIENNNGLIWSVVKRFESRGYELEDLYQIGCIGFIKAVKRFDTTFEVKLSTYALPYILGELKRFIRDDGDIKVSRSLKDLACKIRDIENNFFNDNNRQITVLEIAKELKVSKEDVVLAMDLKNPIISIYDEKYLGDDGDVCLADKLSTNVDEEEKIVNKISIKELIKDLDDREKELILLRYYKNKTQTQVARILNISQVQVSRIEKKILNSMKLKLAM